MPWAFPRPDPGRGDFVRYIGVPPQPVVIELLVPTPEGAPRETRSQVVEVPGYFIIEMTNGYLIPEHWMLEQANVGVYVWRRVPEEFRRR